MTARLAGSIAGAEIWVSSRAKADLERSRSGSDLDPGRRWRPHDVTLKGIGPERPWSLVAERDGEGVPLLPRLRCRPKNAAPKPPGTISRQNWPALSASKFISSAAPYPISSRRPSADPPSAIAGHRSNQSSQSFIRARPDFRTSRRQTRLF